MSRIIKKEHKNYLVLSVVVTLVLFVLGMLVRYIVDPAGLNNKVDLGLSKNVLLSQRTQKFVELNDFKPNTIMLGGSRVHYLNNKDLEKYTHDKVYNLGLNSATLEEQYYFLKYSIEHFDIKNVIIGLNLYPFSEKLRKNKRNDFDKEIFENGFTISKQIHHYLDLRFLSYLKYALYTNYKQEIFFKDGAITLSYQEFLLKKRTWQKREKSSLEGYHEIYMNYLELGDSGFNYLRKMVKLCKDNNINLKVYTTAIHIKQLQILEELNKMDIYYKWKEEVAKITPYYDFMYRNSITINDDNYIDTSHGKQKLGALYFAKLFEDHSINVPKDFGVFIKNKMQY